MQSVGVVFISCLLLSCSGSNPGEGNDGLAGTPGSGGTTGTGAGGNARGAAGAAGNGGSPGTDGGQAGGPSSSSLFGDPRVPDCEPGFVAVAKVIGTLDGGTVSYEFGGSSVLRAGVYRKERVVDGGVRTDFELTWTGALATGVATRVTGGRFLLPDDQPGGGMFYCVTSGEFGPVPQAEQPTMPNTASFKFRIDGARVGEDCSGRGIQTDLGGCIFRTNDYIP